MSPLLQQSVFAFFATLMMLILLAPVARRLGLVDKPGDRKAHRGDTPLVGGIALFITLMAGSVLWGGINQTLITLHTSQWHWVFLLCGGFLVVAGALDDRYQLGVFMRVLSEIVVALFVVDALNLRVSNLGDLVGQGDIRLPATVSYAFTVIAIFGVINAFNMLDGVDGLLAGLVVTSLAAFHVFTGTSPGYVSLFIFSSLLAFLVSNLELSPYIPKTFLGDSGSKLLGFIVVCLLLAATTSKIGGSRLVAPATALYIIGLPLFDMTLTTLRRVAKGHSPFAADRQHIHHLLSTLGFSDRRALLLLLAMNLSVMFLGLMLHRAGVPARYQLSIFLASFGVYCLVVSHAWRVADRLEQLADAMSPSGAARADAVSGSH